MTSVFWFRRDARLDDNAGLNAAGLDGPVVPLFVVDPDIYEPSAERRRNLLIAGLEDLDRAIGDAGGRLRVEYGDPREVVPRVTSEENADSVHVSAEITPYGMARDEEVGKRVELISHEGIYARPPGSVLTDEGQPYKVFTPFYRTWSESRLIPHDLSPAITFTQSEGDGLPERGEVPVPAGARGARGRLEAFLDRVDGYKEERDRIDLDTTSHLSVDLKYGWIGPRRLAVEVGTSTEGRKAFHRQVAWRDFYGHLLDAHPYLVEASFDERYRTMGWRNDEEEIAAWKQGQTGYPLVDAAMRRLVGEGQMHNRVRMVVASFLVKDLLVDWRIGERFFRHHLIDGDVAQNAGNWQWVAGTGTDAAPYFRVFNPVTQSKKFDPKGRFIRSWVPELADTPDEWVHSPWDAGPLELVSYGVELGKDYPNPIVDHGTARERAIGAYEEARRSR